MKNRRFFLMVSLGLVGLVAALRRRRQHLHTVDGFSERVKSCAVPTQVNDYFSPLLDPALSVFVLKDSRQSYPPDATHNPVKRSFIEHEDRSRNGSLQFDVRVLGSVSHQYASVGSLAQAFVARAAAATPAGNRSIAIPRAA